MKEFHHSLCITVNLDALADNYHRLCRAAKGKPVFPVVKANAYGCGAVEVTRRLLKEGAKTFFVATLAEGAALRAAFSDIDIYILEGRTIETDDIFADNRLRPVLNAFKDISEYADFRSRRPDAPSAALHFDTGMRRLGLSCQETQILLSSEKNHLSGAGVNRIMTHPACADTPEHPLNLEQKRRFAQIRARFPTLRASYANSAAALTDPDTTGDGVRAGIALYGGFEHPDIRPVVSFEARILQIRHAEDGESVGYGASESVNRPSRLATVACGYADGLPRFISNTGFHAILNGYKTPLIGRVSMDLTVFDVTDIPEAAINPGDRIELFGENATIFDLAARAQTIPYEILAGLSRRAARVFIDHSTDPA